MSKVPPTYYGEIDLLSLIETVWDGKWKIAFIIVVSLLSVFGLNIIKPNTIFIASTEIKPITSFQFDRYGLFNESLKKIVKGEEGEEKALNIFEITQKSLLNLYVEAVEEGSIIETGIDKYNLINKDDFDIEDDYRKAVEKFASEIKILKPLQENKIFSFHILNGEYDDKNKWNDLLTFVDEEANRNVKSAIINRFATIMSIQTQKKDFAIKDLDIKIENVKNDYEKNTKRRLAFLSEQAAIARKLNIQKNTIASQNFSAQNTLVTNVKTDAPFYLRGYVAIEEEIKQISSRKDKDSFTKDLFRLEQKKRELEQDKTIQRAVDLFNKTPLNGSDFKATIVKVATTNFKENNKIYLYYTLAIVLGGIIGVVYVLIANALQNRKIIQ